MSKYKSKYSGPEIDAALDAFNEVKEYKVQLTPDSNRYYHLGVNKTYRIYSTKTEEGKFPHSIHYSYIINGNQNSSTLYSSIEEADPYAYYDEFRLLQHSIAHLSDGSITTVIWEINGRRVESRIFSSHGTELYDVPIIVKDADSVVCINEDISIKALSGDSVFIRYSEYADGTNFTEEWNATKSYIGIATGQTAPTDKEDYTWCNFSGNGGGTNFDYEALVEEVTEKVIDSLPAAEKVSV